MRRKPEANIDPDLHDTFLLSAVIELLELWLSFCEEISFSLQSQPWALLDRFECLFILQVNLYLYEESISTSDTACSTLTKANTPKSVCRAKTMYYSGANTVTGPHPRYFPGTTNFWEAFPYPPPGESGCTALHHAATEGHAEVAALLLEQGAFPDPQDEMHGNTPLHEAAWKGFSTTLEVLCKHRANPYILNKGGFSPLHLACQNGHNQSCRVILLAGCRPDIPNNLSRSHSEPSYCLPGFGGGPGVVNPTPPIEQFLAQRGFWERGDELQYAPLEHPTHALLDSGPEIWLANPSFEYSHSGDIH
ncbi:ANKRD6 [Cordylochernes scorpioides]|uniref:Alpha-latrotoxin n=1 Tax=Cordylochernes scorpioides TaxID=51811 RepID=A0ABY6LSV7_9ARAC|nr:ANKRD6 [Cordylochernes scorpioides]